MPESRNAVIPTVSKPPKALGVRLATIARCLLVLTVIGVMAALYVTKEIAAPIVLAILMSLLLSPIVTLGERLCRSRTLASALTLLMVLGVAGGALYELTQPAKDWIAKAPDAVRSVNHRFKDWVVPVQEAQNVTDNLQAITQPSKGPAAVVVKDGGGLLSGILTYTPGVLGSVAGVLLLLFFFLSSGDNFLRRLVEIAPQMNEKRRVVSIARDIQREMSLYLQTITLINFGLGCATALVLATLGVPNSILWGAMVGLLNFAPYVGATISAAVLLIVGFSTFDNLAHAAAVPGAFLLLAIVEGQVVTPIILGRRLALNPVVVFVWLLLWGWLWGIVGILLAGPLLACFRIICQHTEALRPIYILIGEARFDDSSAD